MEMENFGLSQEEIDNLLKAICEGTGEKYTSEIIFEDSFEPPPPTKLKRRQIINIDFEDDRKKDCLFLIEKYKLLKQKCEKLGIQEVVFEEKDVTISEKLDAIEKSLAHIESTGVEGERLTLRRK